MSNETRKKAIELIKSNRDCIVKMDTGVVFTKGVLSLLDELESILQNDGEGKLAIYCNDNQWHCYKCNEVVYVGRLNCDRCGQKLLWPDNENKGEG